MTVTKLKRMIMSYTYIYCKIMSEKSIVHRAKNGGFTYFSLLCINQTHKFKKNMARKLDYYVCTSAHTFKMKTAAL